MENISLLAVTFFALGFGYTLTFDHNPIFCRTLSIKFILGKKSVLRKFFPGKEHRTHPYSYFRIIPFFFGCVMSVFVFPLYAIYFFFEVHWVRNFIESRVSFILGFSILCFYILYPLVLMLINKIFELYEGLLDAEAWKSLEKKYEEYYKKLD